VCPGDGAFACPRLSARRERRRALRLGPAFASGRAQRRPAHLDPATLACCRCACPGAAPPREPARRSGPALEAQADLAHECRPHRDDAECTADSAAFDLHEGADPLVLGEDPLHALHAEPVDGPECSGEVARPGDPRVARRVEAVVVPGREIERGERSTLEGGGFRVAAEQGAQRIGSPLHLQERPAAHRARRAPRPVARRDHGFRVRVDGPRVVGESAREEGLERRKRPDRVAHLAEVDAHQAAEQADLRALQRRGQAQGGASSGRARQQVQRKAAQGADCEPSPPVSQHGPRVVADARGGNRRPERAPPLPRLRLGRGETAVRWAVGAPFCAEPAAALPTAVRRPSPARRRALQVASWRLRRVESPRAI
jgi:hypothetical protein